ncbi:hypothetical protein ACFY3G_43305 [Streptomyces phaeochromogenes]|uniref:hypothetical protein n=1 Tax=Streptomyces phaeochromogenes TaxID=1923 RepID=UPI00368B3649
MSRKKARKPRRPRPGGKVTVRIEPASGVSVEVVLQGYSGDDYRQAQAKAQAGDLHAPEIWQLVEALSVAVGHDLDPSQWGDADFLKVLQMLGLIGENEWSAADDAALARLLDGEGVSDD